MAAIKCRKREATNPETPSVTVLSVQLVFAMFMLMVHAAADTVSVNSSHMISVFVIHK